jgi:hypothetical protein
MTYGKRVAAMPTSSYQTQDRLRNLGTDLSTTIMSHETVLRDHAVMIDEINNNLEKLGAFIDWIDGTYPDIMTQYKAIKDIQESANGQG